MADGLRVLLKREAGGEHGNVSTPAPPLVQNGNTTPAPSSGSSTVYIVVGVVVPLVLIGIGIGLFYVWYRKKYPVRMVIGKDFERFSNPAYNKRNSTLTLVREDAEHYWDTFQPSGIQNPGLSLVDEEDEEAVRNIASRRVEEIDETDASVQMENIERMIECGNIETIEQQSNVTEAISNSDKTEADDFEIVQTEHASDQNVAKTGKPRKAMLIKDQNFEELDAGFEIVSEMDLEQPTESEKSSLNDSTGTHTIALSIAGTTDGSINSESLSQESAEDNTKERSNTDTLVQQHEKDVADRDDASNADQSVEIEAPRHKGEVEEINKSREIPVNGDQFADNSINSAADMLNEDHNLNENITENNINLQVDIADHTMPNNSFEEIAAPYSIESTESLLPESTEGQTSQESNSENSLENIDFEASDFTERPKLTLSTEKIYLEDVPPTPTVVIQDSIIFESESVSPVHLDDVQEPPVRQRRAHTIECVSENLKNTKETENTVTKDWYSFGDIDKMSISKDSIELFEPIGKVRLDSSKDNDVELGEIEMKQPAPTELTSEIAEKLPAEIHTDICQIPDLEQTTPLSNATKSEEPDTTLSSLGSFSFEVLNDSIVNSENSVDDRAETVELHHEQNVSFTLSESTHSNISHDVNNEVISNDILDVKQEEPVSHDINLTEPNTNLLTGDSVVQEPNSALLIDNNSATISNYSMLSDMSIEIKQGDEKTGSLISTPSEIHDSMLISMDDEPGNKETDTIDIPSQNTIQTETQQMPDVSDMTTNLLDFANDDQTTNAVSTGENVAFFDLINGTDSLNTFSMNSSLPMSTENQTNELDLFLADSGPKATNDFPTEENTFEESFQQFQTSFLNASTPTASLVTDPLVAFDDGNDLLNENLSKDAQTTPSNTEGSFGIFDPVDVSKVSEESTTEALLNRMLSTESSSIHSWELVSEDGEKNISGSMDTEDSPTIAMASIVTLDDDSHESGKEDESPGLINIVTDEVRNKTKITPTGINFDFSAINDNDDDDDDTDDVDSSDNDDDNDIRPSNDSNQSMTGDGNVSWEVLDDDTEA